MPHGAFPLCVMRHPLFLTSRSGPAHSLHQSGRPAVHISQVTAGAFVLFEGRNANHQQSRRYQMKTRLLLSIYAAGALLAMQGMVGCSSDGGGLSATGGAKGTGGTPGAGGTTITTTIRGTGGSPGTGGVGPGTGGAPGAGGTTTTQPRPDAATDAVIRRDATSGPEAAGDAPACGALGEACCTGAGTTPCDTGLTCGGTGGNRTCRAAAVDGG